MNHNLIVNVNQCEKLIFKFSLFVRNNNANLLWVETKK